MFENLIQRAKNMILTPQSEWDVVAQETVSTGDVYKNYVAPLSAIPPIATFIGMTLVGVSVPFMGHIRVSFDTGLMTAIISFVLGLVGVYILALIIDALAPTFGGEKNRMQSLKVAAFSYTPVWVAGVLNVIPALGMLVLLASLYSLYVLYLGLPKLMKAPEDKALGYTAAVIVCAIVIGIVLGTVTGLVAGMSRNNLGMHASTDMPPSADAALQNLQRLGEQMEAAQKSGDQDAQAAAAGAAIQELARAGEKMESAEKSGDQAAAQAAALEGILKAAAAAEEASKANSGDNQGQ